MSKTSAKSPTKNVGGCCGTGKSQILDSTIEGGERLMKDAEEGTRVALSLVTNSAIKGREKFFQM